MSELRVIKCGTHAVTIIDNIEGIITAVSIRFDNIQYELSFFANKDPKTVWLNEVEFTIKTKERQKIGFI